MPIILYKKTKDYDEWEDVERKIAFEAKKLRETSPKSELDKVEQQIKEIRKKAGLDPKTGFADKKATPCCPVSTKYPEKNIGYLETMIGSESILNSLKEVGFDLKNILEIDESSRWQFISWFVVKGKFNDEIKKAREKVNTQKKYKILTYYCSDYFSSRDDVKDKIMEDINKHKTKRGVEFEKPMTVYGVFLGDNRIYVAVENKEIKILHDFLNNIEETVEYVLSQKFPYDYILRWE